MVVGYLPRTIDGELDDLFLGLAAIAIEGANDVGKTATAQRRATSVIALDNPNARNLFAADPSRLRRAEPPVLVDEWQRWRHCACE